MTDQPRFTPRLQWVNPHTGQMTSEAQRILSAIIEGLWTRSGLLTSDIITGTAGTPDNLAKWNADGDLVDGGSSDIITRWTVASASGPASLDFREDTDNGTNRVRVTAPSALGADRTLTMPDATGTIMLTSAIGSTVQAWDADLDSWAAVVRASGFDTFVATPSSANLRGLLTDETGTGAAVFANTPTLVTPVLGAATATSINFGGSTLSVYAEGTFTPGMTFNGSATGVTYTTQTGSYTMIGNRCLWESNIVLSSNGSGVGTARQTALPFTSAANSPAATFPAAGFSGLTAGINAVVESGATTIVFRGPSTTGGSTLTDTNITDTASFRLGGNYPV